MTSSGPPKRTADATSGDGKRQGRVQGPSPGEVQGHPPAVRRAGQEQRRGHPRDRGEERGGDARPPHLHDRPAAEDRGREDEPGDAGAPRPSEAHGNAHARVVDRVGHRHVHPGQKERHQTGPRQPDEGPPPPAHVGAWKQVVLGGDGGAVLVQGLLGGGELLEGDEGHAAHGAGLGLGLLEHVAAEGAREEGHLRMITHGDAGSGHRKVMTAPETVKVPTLASARRRLGGIQRALSFMQAARPSAVCESMPHWYLRGVTP